MIVSRVHPGPIEVVDLEEPTSRDRLLSWYRPPRAEWLRINLVLSASGSAAGSDGTSESLTSAVDRRILGVIRELADVVLVGAASVRAEGYQVPKRSRLAILTATGDVEGHRLENPEPGRVIVVGPLEAIARARRSLPSAEAIEVPVDGRGDGRVDVAVAIAALRAAGHPSIVCEGGPGLAGQLVAARLVDELCLTTSPTITTVRVPGLAGDLGETDLDLGHLLVDDSGSVFARWTTRAD